MSSQPRTSAREEERRLNIQTLVLASVGSAAAAAVTSQFWIQGTWVAAAVTPLIVTLVSELLRKPTTVIAERVTSRGTAVGPDRELPAREPQARGVAAGPRPPEERSPSTTAPVRVYRTGGRGGSAKPATPARAPSRRRRIAVGAVALTAVLAFAIAVLAITGTELLTGGSIGKGGGKTTLFSGDSAGSEESSGETEQQPEDSQQPAEGDAGSGEEGTGQEQTQPTQPAEEPPPQSQQEPAPETPEVPEPQQQP